MPRDLFQQQPQDKSPPSPSAPTMFLSESPNNMSSGPSSPDPANPEKGTTEQQRQFVIVPPDQWFQAHPRSSSLLPANLHPYVRPLTVSDVESCVALENAAFEDPNERASREKFIYRLTKCGELCLGLFTTVTPNSNPPFSSPTLASARVIETGRPSGDVSVLLAHIIAVKTTSHVVTDESMDLPRDWDAVNPTPSPLGHQERGRTIVLHSVAVAPGFQGKGLGQVLMRAYFGLMNGAGIAERLALIAHDHKVSWYEKLGFTNNGKSAAQFGGGGWYDLVYDLQPAEKRARYG
ncbi:putative polyamine acetyltransferase [Venustampulla echinocandica]|uniref:Putative polyamine acetyltransferase n=1 Tax=Venustampulla echinocandica TaxID=2656787 RepID=A0A370TTL9_9HELO|nr:putative polyamine acetyltransferase [Venustampulla echinocandica]RDL38863.1 putative polyamine acetyltransferase [Venustampulla echinocandica]